MNIIVEVVLHLLVKAEVLISVHKSLMFLHLELVLIVGQFLDGLRLDCLVKDKWDKLGLQRVLPLCFLDYWLEGRGLRALCGSETRD